MRDVDGPQDPNEPTPDPNSRFSVDLPGPLSVAAPAPLSDQTYASQRHEHRVGFGGARSSFIVMRLGGQVKLRCRVGATGGKHVDVGLYPWYPDDPAIDGDHWPATT